MCFFWCIRAFRLWWVTATDLHFSVLPIALRATAPVTTPLSALSCAALNFFDMRQEGSRRGPSSTRQKQADPVKLRKTFFLWKQAIAAAENGAQYVCLWRACCDQAARPGQDRKGNWAIIASMRHDVQNHSWAYLFFSGRVILYYRYRKRKLSKRNKMFCRADVRKIIWAERTTNYHKVARLSVSTSARRGYSSYAESYLQNVTQHCQRKRRGMDGDFKGPSALAVHFSLHVLLARLPPGVMRLAMPNLIRGRKNHARFVRSERALRTGP